jgi:hypothetical protein
MSNDLVISGLSRLAIYIISGLEIIKVSALVIPGQGLPVPRIW